MDKPQGLFAKIFYYLWLIFKTNAVVIFGLIALMITIFGVIVPIFSDETIKVPDGAALVFAPRGVITEQKQNSDPISEAVNESLGNSQPPEEDVHELLAILESAKDDDRISMLAIYPGGISSVGTSMLEMLRDGIADFKTSGKKVIAYGDSMSQAQYYLAAQADEVYIHPYGAVVLEGYSRIGTYFKSLLDNLMVTPHVFRVGTYKSAVEPYLRDDMSEPAKEANRAFLGDLWSMYKEDIAAAREIDVDSIDSNINDYSDILSQYDGNLAETTVALGLVDGLKSRPEFREMMVEAVGANEKETSYKQISHRQYWKASKPLVDFVNPDKDKVALIIAKGVIMDGSQKDGTIGGDTLAEKIRRARTNEKVKAIVMRVDSPGGSAFASEVIRQELLKAKEQGIKVVTTMGTYAASGGYWISANSDEIWAHPSTVTGSIGIFGFIPTFERSLEWAGINRDGVGTTSLAGSMDPMRGLSEDVKSIIQANIEHGYQRFLSIVAEGRGMTLEEVDAIAQGRVWSGSTAKELGLVDQLGGIDEAISSAAALASLEEGSYDVWHVKRELSEREKLIKEILNASAIELDTIADRATPTSSVNGVMGKLQDEFSRFQQFNDPSHAYVLCECAINL